MPLWSLTSRETSRHLRRTHFLLISVTAVIAVALIVQLGARDYHFRAAQLAQRSVQRQEDRTRSGGRVFGWSLEPGLRALRAPAVGTVLVKGLDAILPAFWDFAPAGVLAGPASASQTQSSEVGPLFDLEGLVRILLGLLAILMGLDTSAGDRATGNLRALMSQPVSPQLILAGKLAGGAIALAVALVALSVVVMGDIWLTAPDLLAHTTPALGVFDVAAFLYVAGLFVGGLVIGTLIRTVETGFMVTIACWLATALVFPQLVVYGPRAVVPTPPRQTVELERQTIFDTRLRATEENVGAALVAIAGVPKGSLTYAANPIVGAQVRALWQDQVRDTRKILNTIDERADQAAAHQQRLIDRWSWTNPGSLFLTVAANLAGTGHEMQTDWETATRRYQHEMNGRLFDDWPRLNLLLPTDAGLAKISFDLRPPPTIRELPAFTSPDEGLRTRIKQSALGLVGLAAYLVLFVAVAVLVFPAVLHDE